MTDLDGMDYPAAQHADQDLRGSWAEIIPRFQNANYLHANRVWPDPDRLIHEICTRVVGPPL